MNSKRQIVLEREGLVGLKDLVEVYQEVAAARMQRVRGAVLQSRLFMQGLVRVFAKVRSAYQKLPKRPIMMRRPNGRVVAILASANVGLYGEIVDRTFEKFYQYVKENKSDVVVLGKLGGKMMAERMPEVLYNYFDFPDDTIDPETFEIVMRYLIQFENIVVFHGQFKTILSQVPVETQVSSTVAENTLESTQGLDKGGSYLFEPSVDEVARVFEGEILASIFEQTLHESTLAKQASRMLSLDRSIENIDKKLESVKVEEVRISHRLRGRKQLNTIAGVGLWG